MNVAGVDPERGLGRLGPGAGGNLVLTGFMGTGKTAVGREVARRLKRRFVDLDEEIVRAAGRSIPRIFAEEGESGFRAWERRVAREHGHARGLVVATGGGLVLQPEAMGWLAAGGMVVCLDASVPEILRRVGRSRNRPLLQSADRERQVRELLDQRRPLYEAVEPHVATDGLTRDQVAEAVIRLAEAGGLIRR